MADVRAGCGRIPKYAAGFAETSCVVDERGGLACSLRDVEHGRQLFVVDLDQLDRLRAWAAVAAAMAATGSPTYCATSTASTRSSAIWQLHGLGRGRPA